MGGASTSPPTTTKAAEHHANYSHPPDRNAPYQDPWCGSRSYRNYPRARHRETHRRDRADRKCRFLFLFQQPSFIPESSRLKLEPANEQIQTGDVDLWLQKSVSTVGTAIGGPIPFGHSPATSAPGETAESGHILGPVVEKDE